jgi:hypothetical protein
MTSSSIQEISGNVGIGTGGTAAYKLNVAGTGAFDTIFSR